MKQNIQIHDLAEASAVELVERKGLGHPDSICDAVAEEASRALCRYELEQFGTILHHNLDKALLVGGRSAPEFRGGRLLEPIELYIAGRATGQWNDRRIPIEDLVVESANRWIRIHLRFIEPGKDLIVIPKIRSGSGELTALFEHPGMDTIPMANDSSFGAAYFPLSPLEQSVLRIEKLLNDPETKTLLPFVGEDIKVMGIRQDESTSFTIAVAMVDRFIIDVQDYMHKIDAMHAFIRQQLHLESSRIDFNTADDYTTGKLYLTVSGTSAESGDDGQVGRGNRLNGLITPGRPMSLEAVSGKNPVSHVGKIYNHFALELCQSIC